MSPQFVDFDGDGHLDIVAGIYDGSPHVALGTAKGWKQPVPILDREGARIVMNAFYNWDDKKWDATKRCDPDGLALDGAHLTSAWATDWDGDGDLDLLLGDYRKGHVMLRRNEGTAGQAAFATKNTVVLAAGVPLRVPGNCATLRLVDWNGDGLLDLVCGAMGDSYTDGPGGGIYVYENRGMRNAPAFDKPVVLVAPSAKGGSAPTRPDAGLYMDVADHDGDGDLDLLVGGYSQWTPPARDLSPEERARAAELRKEIAELDKRNAAFAAELRTATEGLDTDARRAKLTEVLAAQGAERAKLAKERSALQADLDALVPTKMRVSYVWLYENRTKGAAGTVEANADKR